MQTNCPAVKKQGIGLTEVVIGAGILFTILFSAYQFIVQVRALENQTTSIIRANYLLLEAVDVVRILRDQSWTTNIDPLSLNTNYYFEWNSTAWEITAQESVIDGKFYRYAQFDEVRRDANDNIATSGTVDPDTLKITATVEWFENKATSTRTFETYVTNLYQD